MQLAPDLAYAVNAEVLFPDALDFRTQPAIALDWRGLPHDPSMVCKLMESAQKRWRCIKRFQLLELVVNNVEFRDGEVLEDQSDRNAA